MSDVHRSEGEPHDRLTSIGNEMTAHLPDDVKAVIMLQDSERGGITLANYDDDVEAMADLFVHLKAIFEANGKTLMLAGLGQELGRG